MAERGQTSRLNVPASLGDTTPSSPSSEYVNPFVDPESLSPSSGSSSIRSEPLVAPVEARVEEPPGDLIVSLSISPTQNLNHLHFLAACSTR
jgi:hypothetical protein